MTILTVFLLLLACIPRNAGNELNRNHTNDSIVLLKSFQDSLFANWLKSNNLTVSYFKDSLAIWQFELWAYRENLNKIDSLSFWHPSKDSSYYLLTNFDFKTGKKINNKVDYVRLQFLDVKSRIVYDGLLYMNTKIATPISFYWYDNKTIYILDKLKAKQSFILTRLSPSVDSIWTYGNNLEKEKKNAP